MKRMVYINAIFFFLFCTPINIQRSKYYSEKSILHSLIDTIYTFKASGDFMFTLRGEKYRGKIVVDFDEGYVFKCYLYAPFANSIASFISDSDSAKIIFSEESYRIGIREKVTSIPFLQNYPFTFKDIIRILTGRTYKSDSFLSDPIINKTDAKRRIYQWISDSLNILILASSRKEKIKNITYTNKEVPWKLVLSSFKNGISKEIHFESGEKNYFSVMFNKLEYK